MKPLLAALALLAALNLPAPHARPVPTAAEPLRRGAVVRVVDDERVRLARAGRSKVAGGLSEGRGVAVTNRKRPGSALPSGPVGVLADRWHRLVMCESGGRGVTRGPYHSYFQWSLPTWWSVTGRNGKGERTRPDAGTYFPEASSYATQLAAAERLLARSGRGSWPVCGRFL